MPHTMMDVVQEPNHAWSPPASLVRKAGAGASCSPKQRLPQTSHSKKPGVAQPVRHHDGESDVEFESEDDGFDHPRIPQQDAMDLDVDADGEPDMEDESDADEGHKGERKLMQQKHAQPARVFDDDGESEIDEVESDEEPDVPLASLPAPPQPAIPYLHVSHKLFPGHNRPFGELIAPSSSTIFAKDALPGAPFVPYARVPPPYVHGILQRAWHVPEQGVARTKAPKRRGKAMMYGETVLIAPTPASSQDVRPILPHIVPGETLPQYFTYQYPPPPPLVEEKPRRVVRRPYSCLYKDCTLAFPSPKDRGRHMDKHFEGRFECMRCHKRYARVDALKRHCSEMFKTRRADGAGGSTRSYAPTATCVGGFEAKEWKEVSGSLWLKPEHVLNLRLPDPQDPLYPQISRLLHEAHYNARMSAVKQEEQPPLDASTSAQPSLDSLDRLIKLEPLNDELPDVEMDTPLSRLAASESSSSSGSPGLSPPAAPVGSTPQLQNPTRVCDKAQCPPQSPRSPTVTSNSLSSIATSDSESASVMA